MSVRVCVRVGKEIKSNRRYNESQAEVNEEFIAKFTWKSH